MWLYYLAGLYLIYAIVVVRFLNTLLFKKLKFTETRDPELPENWKPFERQDRKNWRIYEIYFGALFLLPIRLLIMVIALSFGFLVFLIGGVQYDQPWPKRRFQYVKKIMGTAGRVLLFSAGFYYIPHKILSYSLFDKDYVQSESDRNCQNPCIMISNHVSFWDSFYIGKHFVPSFLAKQAVRKLPWVGYFAVNAKAIFVDRDNKDSKDNVISQIKNRVAKIQNKENFPPVIIFPEGTTTNGKYLLTFKRGAFAGLQPVKIICLKYSDRFFNVALDNIGMIGMFLAMTQLYNKMECYEFQGVYNPLFLQDQTIPYEEKWQMFAESTRDIISQCLGIEKSQASLNDTWDYENFLFPKEKRQ